MLAPGLNRSELTRSDSTEAHGRHLFHWSSQLFVGFFMLCGFPNASAWP